MPPWIPCSLAAYCLWDCEADGYRDGDLCSDGCRRGDGYTHEDSESLNENLLHWRCAYLSRPSHLFIPSPCPSGRLPCFLVPRLACLPGGGSASVAAFNHALCWGGEETGFYFAIDPYHVPPPPRPMTKLPPPPLHGQNKTPSCETGAEGSLPPPV